MRGIVRGAQVVLRSGGPVMVIERIDTLYGSPERYALCKWFDKFRLKSERLSLHILELCDEAPAVEAGEPEVTLFTPEREAALIDQLAADADAEADAWADQLAREEREDRRSGDDPAVERNSTIAERITAARRRAEEAAGEGRSGAVPWGFVDAPQGRADAESP